MRKEELESMVERDEELKKLLEIISSRVLRKVERRSFIHVCCDEEMIKIRQYKIVEGSRGVTHEVKLPEVIYYCPKCHDSYEVRAFMGI